jgi:hypothetical protein
MDKLALGLGGLQQAGGMALQVAGMLGQLDANRRLESDLDPRNSATYVAPDSPGVVGSPDRRRFNKATNEWEAIPGEQAAWEIGGRGDPVVTQTLQNMWNAGQGDEAQRFNRAVQLQDEQRSLIRDNLGRTDELYDPIVNRAQQLMLTDAMTDQDVQNIATQYRNSALQQNQAQQRTMADNMGARGLSPDALMAMQAMQGQQTMADYLNAELEAKIQQSAINRAFANDAVRTAGDVSNQYLGRRSQDNNILAALLDPSMDPYGQMLDRQRAEEFALGNLMYGAGTAGAGMAADIGAGLGEQGASLWNAVLSRPEPQSSGIGSALVGAGGSIGGGLLGNPGLF